MRHGCHYTSLEPAMWRTLLARAAVFRAVRSRLGDLWDAANDPARYGRSVKRALEHLYDTAEEVAANTHDDRQVVGQVVGTWRDEIRQISRGTATKPEAAPLLDELHSLAKEAEENDPFQELLDKVEVHASAIYDRHWRQVLLSLGHIQRHPRRRPDDPYGLDATTKIVNDRARLELDIWPPEFGPATYAAIPMVFVHECVCHVPARQEKNDNTSTFAEGFLDWAAMFFLQMWMAHLDADLSAAALEHAAQLGAVLKQDPNPGWAQRTIGHRRAESLATWLQVELERSAYEARMKVARLAVELNQLDVPLGAKDHFVSRLRAPLAPQLQGRLRAWEAGLAPAGELLDAP